MKKVPKTELDEVLDWSASTLGQIQVMSDHSKIHGGHESSICRLLAPTGFYYLKIHQNQSHWHNEVHAYERWACAFGDYAPKLLAVRDTEPLALIVSELPGQIMENTRLPISQERAIWRAAGSALEVLHDLRQVNSLARAYVMEQVQKDFSKMQGNTYPTGSKIRWNAQFKRNISILMSYLPSEPRIN